MKLSHKLFQTWTHSYKNNNWLKHCSVLYCTVFVMRLTYDYFSLKDTLWFGVVFRFDWTNYIFEKYLKYHPKWDPKLTLTHSQNVDGTDYADEWLNLFQNLFSFKLYSFVQIQNSVLYLTEKYKSASQTFKHCQILSQNLWVICTEFF